MRGQDVDEEEANWNRVMVGYLVLLCTWLWDSPKTVKEFLNESSNLQVVSVALDAQCVHVADGVTTFSSFNQLPKQQE
jgi:hypothetical protein